MTTIYCTDIELKALLYGREELRSEIEHIKIDAHFDDYIQNTKNRKKLFKFKDVPHPFFNPKVNSVIIFDRRVIERDFQFMTNYMGASFRDELFDLW